ncbi:hypothetical protein [Methylococcus capsulatus]|jgi:hypothetical protein|uniref:hypothetical protein n=1 Tax=Methylococcus capsulatus TaxID=414 RepID=UPI001C5295BD|nr:hypothetical protein [Methylococcus capsulatus]QXP90904.1 hypothetical protein KW114_01685 [Methylococcus capsulatus]
MGQQYQAGAGTHKDTGVGLTDTLHEEAKACPGGRSARPEPAAAVVVHGMAPAVFSH